MEASVSTSQHTFAHRPQGMNMSHDAQQAQGPHQPAQGPYGSLGLGEQHKLPPQHQKPYFYIQPSQPYVPMQNMQWHMPVSYNPYYGYPGLSYAMPATNTYPMSAYVEPPGYVMPQTHLHLVDYRRMLNPHYYHTLAYHSRSLHYQHGSSGREMISAEVQTEPLSVSQKSTAACGVGRVEAHSDFPEGIHDCAERSYTGPAHLLPQARSAKTGDGSVDLRKTSPSPVENAPQKSGFVIQTEELRIECCATAGGLEVLRSRETQELALAQRCTAQDPARCGSVITCIPVLQEVATSAPKERSDIGHRACPEVVLVGTVSCGTTVGTPSLREPKAPIVRIDASPDSGSRAEVCGGVAQKTTVAQGQTRDNDANVSCGANDGHFKVLHMPFDLDYLEELRSMETAVWSMEETGVSSPDWMMQTTLTDSHMETLVEEVKAPCKEDLIDVFTEEFTMEQVVPMIEMPQSEEELLIELGSTRDAPVVALASQSDGLASADVCDTEVASMAHLGHASGVSHSHSSGLVVGLPATGDAIQHESELTDQSPQETSFESLPAYLPSTAWPTDYRNVVHCREVPQTPKEPSKSHGARHSEAPIERRKLNLESKEPRAVQRPKAEKIDKTNFNRRSVSDHECCLRRNLNENAFPARRPRVERLCNRCLANRSSSSSSSSRRSCLANRSSCLSVSPGSESAQVLKRKCPSPLQPRLQACVLPTCDACEALTRKRLLHRADICGAGWQEATGGPTSENSSCPKVPKWSGPGDPGRGCADPKRHRASGNRPEKCPPAPSPRLGERNRACDEHRVPGWEGPRRRPPGNALQETNGGNLAVPARFQDKWGSVEKNNGYKWKNEKSFTSTVFNRNMAGRKDAVLSQHLNVQKKSQPLSQGNHRKDTRC